VCRDKVASATGCRGTEPGIRVGACVPDRDWSRVGIGESTRARARARVTRARSCAFARVGARSHHVRLVSRARARWVRARRARTRVIRDRAMVVHAMWRARMRARIRRARASANRPAARARACERFFLETFSRASLSRTVFATAIAHRETREECARRIARIARRALVVARSRMHSRAVRSDARARRRATPTPPRARRRSKTYRAITRTRTCAPPRARATTTTTRRNTNTNAIARRRRRHCFARGWARGFKPSHLTSTTSRVARTHKPPNPPLEACVRPDAHHIDDTHRGFKSTPEPHPIHHRHMRQLRTHTRART